MIFSILRFSAARPPVFLLPPFYGTNLWFSFNQTSGLPRYCPDRLNDSMLWIDPWHFIPFRYNCVIKFMTIFLDANGTLGNWPNVSISIHDFGGDESVRHVMQLKPFNFWVIPVLAPLIDRFKALGYRLKKDLFVAPYDWRIAPVYSDDLFVQLKRLIEESYAENGEKAALFGFSLGGFTLQHFLTHFVDSAWKDKYVSHVVLLAPSHAGTVSNFYNFWTRTTPIMPWVKGDALSLLYESWPVGHDHMPNHVIFKDSEFIIGPQGETYGPSDIFDLAKKHGRIGKQFWPIYEKSEAVISQAPKDPGLKTFLLYNSGRSTPVRVNFTRGWDVPPKFIYGRGDGNVPAEGLDWTCAHWRNLTCFDFADGRKTYEHQPLITNSYVLDIVVNLTLGIEAQLKGEPNPKRHDL
jgi:pimeloyl-ACP methyl ester carboxylesterase